MERSEMKPVMFEHVPKCAGSTVNNWLKRNYAPEFTFGLGGYDPAGQVKQFNAMPSDERRSYELVCGHHASHCNWRTDAVRATVLREPIDRCVSYYHYVKRDKENYYHAIANKLSLGEFYAAAPGRGFGNGITRWFGRDAQHAICVLRGYDLVGFQSDLAAFCIQLMELSGLRVPFEGVIDNANPCRPECEDPSDIKIVRACNTMDVQVWKELVKTLHPEAPLPNS